MQNVNFVVFFALSVPDMLTYTVAYFKNHEKASVFSFMHVELWDCIVEVLQLILNCMNAAMTIDW
jgi:hypothetical protein